MTLCLALKFPEKLALTRYLDNLVENNAVGERHTCKEGEKVGCDGIAVDACLREGLNHRREIDFVNIHKRIRPDHTVTYFQILVRRLEVGHRERAVAELKRHEPVAVFVDLRLRQFPVADTFLCKDVVDL